MNYTFENIESLESGNGTDTLIWNTVLKSNYISNMFWGFYSTRDEDALNLLKMLSGNWKIGSPSGSGDFFCNCTIRNKSAVSHDKYLSLAICKSILKCFLVKES